jgi:hypothetical protein
MTCGHCQAEATARSAAANLESAPVSSQPRFSTFTARLQPYSEGRAVGLERLFAVVNAAGQLLRVAAIHAHPPDVRFTVLAVGDGDNMFPAGRNLMLALKR